MFLELIRDLNLIIEKAYIIITTVALMSRTKVK
jgi:hypothetical protein